MSISRLTNPSAHTPAGICRRFEVGGWSIGHLPFDAPRIDGTNGSTLLWTVVMPAGKFQVVSKRSPVEPLGELESSVMKAVWAKAPITAREVCDGFSGSKERAYTTIMTTLDRLFRKGLLAREKTGLAWNYRPTLDRQEHQKLLADRLATQCLASHGDTGLVAFVDAASNASMLDQLATLIRRRTGRH